MAPVGGLGGFRLLRARALAAATATVAVSAVVAAVTAPRSTVAVAMGAGPAPFPSRPSVSCVDGPRVRKEVGSLTPAEWATYQRAVTGLHARETSRDRSTLDWFEHFVEIHAAHAAYAHGGAHFLAWHRLFLLAYENALRTVEPSVTIPYWDWSMDAADPAMAPVWVTSQLGKSADGGRIGAGERAAGHNFNELFVDTDGPHYVTRGFDSNHRGSMDADFFADKRTVRALWRDRTMSFADFATTLEYVHGGPHVAVGGFSGGDMIMLNRAAGDVAFWSHHAYIDFIWSMRQQAVSVLAYGGRTQDGHRARLDDVLAPFGTTARTAVELDCVTYVEDPRRTRAEPLATPTATPTPSPTATATPTPSPTATATPTPSPTATATPTPSPTATATPTPSPTATATPTPSPTATATPTPSPTATVTPMPTATPAPTATQTLIPTAPPTRPPTLPPTQPPTPLPTPISTWPPTPSFASKPTAVVTSTPPVVLPTQTARTEQTKSPPGPSPHRFTCERSSQCGCGVCVEGQCVAGKPQRTRRLCGGGVCVAGGVQSALVCRCTQDSHCGCGVCHTASGTCRAPSEQRRAVHCGPEGACIIDRQSRRPLSSLFYSCLGGTSCTSHTDCGCGVCSSRRCVARAWQTRRKCGNGAACVVSGTTMACQTERRSSRIAVVATVEAAVRPHFASSGPAGAARGPSSGDARAALAVLKKVMAAARAEAAAELAAAEAEAAEVISMADAEIHEVEEEEKAIAKAASEEGAVSRTAGWLAAAVRGASSVGSAGAVGAAAEAAKLAALEETRTEAEASRQAALAELQARKKEVKRYLRVTALAGFAAINGIDAARFTRGEAPLERAEDEAEAEERAIEGTAASTLTARHTLMGA